MPEEGTAPSSGTSIPPEKESRERGGCCESSRLLMVSGTCANCAANGGEANGDERNDLQRPTNTCEWAHMQARAAVIDCGRQWPTEVHYSDA
jgi:hypothetical protein